MMAGSSGVGLGSLVLGMESLALGKLESVLRNSVGDEAPQSNLPNGVWVSVV